MSTVRLFFELLKWDLLRELRRKETVINMSLFAMLLIFVLKLGLGTDAAIVEPVGPVVFWVTILFSGTVGLSQAFVTEQEEGRLAGVQLAPIELGVFYFSKVSSTWLYVLFMEVLVLAAFVTLFKFHRWDLLASVVAVMSVFTLGYIATGVVLASMTASLRGGGEIVLRILLFPLMMPILILTLRVSETVFAVPVASDAPGTPMELGRYLAIVGAFDVIYLTSGFLIFPKVLEE